MAITSLRQFQSRYLPPACPSREETFWIFLETSICLPLHRTPTWRVSFAASFVIGRGSAFQFPLFPTGLATFSGKSHQSGSWKTGYISWRWHRVGAKSGWGNPLVFVYLRFVFPLFRCQKICVEVAGFFSGQVADLY